MDKDKAKTKKTQKTAENRAKTSDTAAVDYAVTTAKLSDLIPDDKNFNKGTEFGQHLIEKSLRENGAGRSILLDKNNRIIAGNKTTENAAAIDLDDVIIVETDGTKLVAVKRTDIDLDSEQGRQMALADNATSAANLEWDEDALRAMQKEMDNFDPEEWGVKVDLEDVQDNENETNEDDFDENTDQVETRSQLGDIWQLGNHRLMCGDSSDAGSWLLLLDGQKGDMVFTDPPYGVSIGDKNKLLKEKVSNGKNKSITTNIKNDTLGIEPLYKLLVAVMSNLRENCKDDASYYVTAPQGGDLGMMMMMMMKDSGLKVRHNLIWNKNASTFSLGRLDYDYKHEPIMYTWTKSHHNYRKGKFRTTVWDIPKPRKCDLHPTMKPVELVANCLLDCTKENDIILDAFGGSGTTLIAAEQLGRKCYMMELDPHYCDVIIARWEKLTNGKAEKIDLT